MSELYDRLTEYSQSDTYPYHMPGHKRRLQGYPLGEICNIDITEIDGFDNLHHAEGILQEIRQRAAKLWKADASFLLINGSTAGILAAISAVADKGSVILMARNCHRSAYNGIYVNHMRARYLYPEFAEDTNRFAGRITPDTVAEGIRECKRAGERVAAVLITSPTYEGIVSDVQAIAACCHAHDIPLLVDEAHGAHLGFAKDYPDTAIHLGADLVIQSLHKTLPSMTQTAVLHLMGNRISGQRVERFLSIYQTSSPSYVLMSAIDLCMDILEKEGADRLGCRLQDLEKFKHRVERLRHISCIFPDDPLKVLIYAPPGHMTGKQIYDILLEKYHLQLEMAAGTYCLAMFSMMDDEGGYDRLAEALIEMDCSMENENLCQPRTVSKSVELPKPTERMPIHAAYDAPTVQVPLAQSIGRISGDFVMLYPPGIPFIVPGEEISTDVVGYIRESMKRKLNLIGLTAGEDDFLIRVVDEQSE